MARSIPDRTRDSTFPSIKLFVTSSRYTNGAQDSVISFLLACSFILTVIFGIPGRCLTDAACHRPRRHKIKFISAPILTAPEERIHISEVGIVLLLGEGVSVASRPSNQASPRTASSVEASRASTAHRPKVA